MNAKIAEEPLLRRVVRGGLWVFLLQIVKQLFNIGKLIIIARILAPHDFGLMGIALLAMAMLETFSQTGFQAALIQKKEGIDAYLDSAWTILILRGLILFAILYFIAPYVAIFFKTPEAKSMIQIIGFAILLRAFTNIGTIYFQKELEFKKQFIYQFSGVLTDFMVTVSAVFILKSVWALVLGVLAGCFVNCIVSYIIHPYKPRLTWDLSKAKELFGFGKWVLGSSILVFLITQGDDAFVGKFLGATMLGYYQMAYRISNMPATEIAHVISQVTFPAYAKLQNNIPSLKEAYLKVLHITAFLSFPIAGLIFVLAPDFTKIFLGEKWLPMVPAMQVLVFAGLLRSMAATSGYIFYAVGKPRIDTALQIIRLSVLGFLIYPFTNKWGILGVSIVVFLSIFISCIGFGFMCIKITGCGVKDFAKMIILPLINGTIAVLVVLGLKTIMDVGLSEFIMFACVGALIYSIMSYLSDRSFKCRIHVFIKESLQSIRGG